MDVLSSSQRQNAKIVMVTKIFGGMERHPPSGNRREIKKLRNINYQQSASKFSETCQEIL